MKSSIALIGFMGTGKSAVGMVLAEKMGKEFIDLDTMIEQNTGRTIPDIFRRDGEIFFRAMEIEATKEVASKKNAVIACGGGIVLNQINIERLQQENIFVFLTATPEAILRRTSRRPEKRPLLQPITKPSQVASFLNNRRPFYERVADITIDTSQLDVNQVAGRVLEELEKHEDFAG
ncbi:shikimate kinase [Chloroflexota bacterium]